MAISIYMNGTTGGTNGTLEIGGDGVGIALPQEGSVGSYQMRCEAGYRTTEAVSIPAPPDCQVSKNGTTWGSSVTYAIGEIGDVNVPFYIKRTALTLNAPSGGAMLPRAAAVAVDLVGETTDPILTGSITATPSNAQVILDWEDPTDNVGVIGYDVEYGTTESYGSAVSPDPTVSTATVTGLTNGTLYYFRVRAYDASGNTSEWITTTSTPVPSYFTGTLEAETVGGGVLISGLTAHSSGGATLTTLKSRHRLLPSGEWSAENTPMTFWGSPTSWVLTDVYCPIWELGEHEVQLKFNDSAGGASDWVTTAVTVIESTLPYSEDFGELDTDENIHGYDNWWVSNATANLSGGTVLAGVQNGLGGAVMRNNAPATSPATSADVECRKFVEVDISSPTYFEARITPVSASAGVHSVSFRLAGKVGTYVALVYNNGTLTCYNGSTYATIKTGLSNNILVRVIPIYGTQTATIIVNGENLGTITIWRTFDAPINALIFTQTSAGANTTTTGFSNIAIGRV